MGESGGIDILVNNAAIESAYSYDKFEIDVIEKMTAVNLIAPMTLTRLLLPKMIKLSEGHIVNISSLTDRMSALNRSSNSTKV